MALSRDRIVDAAVRVADRGGLDGVSMRSVGRELGVEAMSLYHHIANKEALLDDLVDRVFTAIEFPADGPWRPAMAARATSARTVLSRHPWALGLIESRRHPGPANLRHHDAVLGCLRRSGFTVALAAHTFSVLDAYVFGFVLTEQHLPFEPGEGADEFVENLGLPVDTYPHLAEMISEQVRGRDYAYADEFAYGLDLILDGVAARLPLVDRRYASVGVQEHGTPRPLVPGTRVELRFGADRIVALAGGNVLNLGFRIEPNRLVPVGDIGSTLAGYPEPHTDQDRWLGGFLVAGPAWNVQEDRLTLTVGDTVIELVEIRSGHDRPRTDETAARPTTMYDGPQSPSP
jgi:AcrR family transcriptional regulator